MDTSEAAAVLNGHLKNVTREREPFTRALVVANWQTKSTVSSGLG